MKVLGLAPQSLQNSASGAAVGAEKIERDRLLEERQRLQAVASAETDGENSGEDETRAGIRRLSKFFQLAKKPSSRSKKSRNLSKALSLYQDILEAKDPSQVKGQLVDDYF